MPEYMDTLKLRWEKVIPLFKPRSEHYWYCSTGRFTLVVDIDETHYQVYLDDISIKEKDIPTPKIAAARWLTDLINACRDIDYKKNVKDRQHAYYKNRKGSSK